MTNLTPEMIEKAKTAKSADELLEIAKANGVEMTEDGAKTCFAQLNPKSGELSDDDLDSVAGGACGDAPPEGTEKIPFFKEAFRCDRRICTGCGQHAGTSPTCDGYGTQICDVCRKRASCYNCVNGVQVGDKVYCKTT